MEEQTFIRRVVVFQVKFGIGRYFVNVGWFFSKVIVIEVVRIFILRENMKDSKQSGRDV